MRRPAAGAGEGRGGGTVRGLRGARVQAGRAVGRRADVQADGQRAILARNTNKSRHGSLTATSDFCQLQRKRYSNIQ